MVHKRRREEQLAGNFKGPKNRWNRYVYRATRGKPDMGNFYPGSRSSSPSLSDRFNALPPEIRDEIFAQLIVQPVKWRLEHRESCTFPGPSDQDDMTQSLRLIRNFHDPACVICAAQWQRGHIHPNARFWSIRRDQPDRVGLINPRRSVWAPPVRNPFLCSSCWDSLVRRNGVLGKKNVPCPAVEPPRSLKCLCSRRENLQVFLVCRRWYKEAGVVFYTRNRFAFGAPEECTAFLSNLAPRWRPFVTKVSLIMQERMRDDSSIGLMGLYKDEMDQLDSIKWMGKNIFQGALAELSRLPNLADLELDALWMTDRRLAKMLRACTCTNLRILHFLQGAAIHIIAPEIQIRPIWPRLWLQGLVDGRSRLMTETARGIKGNRVGWVRRGKRELKALVKMEQKAYENYYLLLSAAFRAALGKQDIKQAVDKAEN